MPRMPTFTIALENASNAPERFYYVLLLPTLSHFSPHHRLLLAFVKRKHADFSKIFRKVCLPSAEEELIFHYHRLWFFSRCLSRLSGASSSLGISNFGRSCSLLSGTVIYFKEFATCLLLGAFDHGMDHSSARRDRPELRNQFIRQR